MATTTTMISGSSSHSDCDIILPQDVVFHILLCLPVVALLRLKSVCKSWCALIESSSFITQHLHHHHSHLDNNNCNLLVTDCAYLRATSCPPFSLLLITGANYEVPPIKLEFDSPCFLEPCDVDMVTCNGVICLHIRNLLHTSNILNVFLWNPATRQLRALPQSLFPPPSPERDHPKISVGLGFDVKTNDYKVIRIFTFSRHHNVPRVEVYSLNTDSWKTIDAVLPFHYVFSNPNAPYRNETYCWLGRKATYTPEIPKFLDNFIFSFDFSKEVFQTMSLPDADSVKSDFVLQLAILKDNIACINKVDFELEVWVLNTYGVKESWTKLYKIGPFFRPTPKGLSMNGNFLFLVRDEQFCMYNIVTQELTNLSTRGYLNTSRIQVAEYKESLVSVGKGHGGAIYPTCVVMWKAVEKALGSGFSREKCEVKMVGTPLTHQRFLRRNRGTYGPAIEAGKGTFPGHATTIPQLYCCGDSTFPGIGVPAVAASGAIVFLVSVSEHSQLLDAIGI